MRRTIPVIPLVLAAAAISVLGCSSDSTPAKQCGGWEDPTSKQCFKLCDESKCAANNFCFKEQKDDGAGGLTTVAGPGFCAPPCASKNECGYGYSCVAGEPMVPESTSSTMYCQSLGLTGNGAPGVTCTSDAGCDTSAGLACLGGICTWGCKAIGNCPDGYECKANPSPPAGALAGYCAARNADDFLPGRYGTPCPSGKSDNCDTAGGFMCSGELGSCTKTDGCTQDADCPSGYWCGTRSAAGTGGNVEYSKYHICLQREFCAPCDNDVDCSFIMGAVCVPDINGEKFCTSPCEKETNACIIGAKCADTGNGVFACIPDVGVCHDATPKGCSPCRVDGDCGAEGLCMNANAGLRTGMKWCTTPCGPADSSGKPTCPVAPNGLEMLCLNEDQMALGGPFGSSSPNYQYNHCYAPLANENTEMYPGMDPPQNICGNFLRDPGEECDDGNNTATDGCDKCKVTAACTFTVDEAKNGDVWTGDATIGPVLTPAANHVPTQGNDPMMAYVINTNKNCKSFKVTGSLEAAGDVDTIAFQIDNEGYAWLNSFTGDVGTCTGDLMVEDRAWGNGYMTAELNLLDKTVGCKDLGGIMDTTCGGSTTLCCGATNPGRCGSCDDDNGIGNCNRLLLSQATSLSGGYYSVKYDGKVHLLRVYAHDPSATVSTYTILVSRFTAQNQFGQATPITVMCN